MANHRIVGECCGNFPEPEADAKEKKEKECCNSGGCGCGFGPVQEGSVADASGAVLSQKKVIHSKAEYLIVTKDGEYLVDVNDPRQDEDVIRILMKSETRSQLELLEYYRITVFGLKRGEFPFSYRYHDICPTAVLRVIPWDLEKWKVETSEGIV